MAEISENGTVDSWDLTKTSTGNTNDEGLEIIDNSGRERLALIFKKHLKTIATPQTNVETFPVYTMGGTKLPAIAEYFSIKNTLILADGTILSIGYIESQGLCANNSICAAVVLYLKPKAKKYIQGENLFYFFVLKNNIVPSGRQNEPVAAANTFENDCKYNSTTRANGRGCTAWVILNENMDYLHCNNLSWNGKHRCKD